MHIPTARSSARLLPGWTKTVTHSQSPPLHTTRRRTPQLWEASSSVPLTLHPPSLWLLLSLSSPSQMPFFPAERQAPFPVSLSASAAHSSAAHTGSKPARQKSEKGVQEWASSPGENEQLLLLLLTTVKTHSAAHLAGCSPTPLTVIAAPHVTLAPRFLLHS